MNPQSTRRQVIAQFAAASGVARAASPVEKRFSLAELAAGEPRGVSVSRVVYGGRKALRVADDPKATRTPGSGLVILHSAPFTDGVIELDLSGSVLPDAEEGSRGFVGLAFRVSRGGVQYESFYLRPTNGRAQDQVRRNHSAQYVSHPEYPWQRLRRESPEKYESYVDLVPGAWTRVRVEVRGITGRLFVHGVAQPALLVNDLKLGAASGAVALWIGPGTLAHFAGVRITQ